MDLLDSSQHNNAGVDGNISIKESSTLHLQLASLLSISQFIIIAKVNGSIIQVNIIHSVVIIGIISVMEGFTPPSEQLKLEYICHH